MNPELQQRIQNLLGDESMPSLMTERVAPSFAAASGGPGTISDEEMQLLAGGFAEGGEVSQEEVLMQALAGEAEAQADPSEALRSSIDELMMEASQTDDTAERDKYLQLAEAVEVGSQAPMAEMAIQLAQAGRGEDTALAHVRPGEVILPPEAFEDPEFEEIVERKFRELDLDPERMVVGVGIASLNPITGLEEFGFFKKLAKGVKKVVKKVIKPIAQVAQFIPGPWQPIAALANKAFTVYDVAKGRANPLSLLTVAGPGAVGGSIGQNISQITKAGSGSFLQGLGSLGKQSLGSIGSSVGNIGKGIGGLFMGGGKDGVGNLGRLGDFFGSIGDATGLTNYAGMTVPGFAGGQFPIGEGETAEQAMNRYYNELPDGSFEKQYIGEQRQLINSGLTSPEEIMATINTGFGGFTTGGFSGPLQGQPQNAADVINKYLTENPDGYDSINQMLAQGMSEDQIAAQLMGGQQGGSFFGMKTPDFIKKLGDPFGLGGASGLRDAYGGGGGGGGGFLGGGMGGAGGLALAGLLAKLAYDEAKNRKGVQLTPAITMSPYGGYQLAAMDAERRGEAPPDPREFGMMPRDFMPVLSGGRAPTAAQAELEKQKTGMRYGGAVQPMYFNSGGDVDAEVFIRMNGDIEGEGTEVSDDIPAMLSDGEFVMTGRAVRGAGGFDFDRDKDGIITLIKNGDESREKGTELMYKMMNLFEEFAGAPARARAKS